MKPQRSDFKCLHNNMIINTIPSRYTDYMKSHIVCGRYVICKINDLGKHKSRYIKIYLLNSTNNQP